MSSINNNMIYHPLFEQLCSKVKSTRDTAYRYLCNHKLSAGLAIAALAAIYIFNNSESKSCDMLTDLTTPIKGLSEYCFTFFCTNNQNSTFSYENEAIVTVSNIEDQETLDNLPRISTKELPQALISFFDSLKGPSYFEVPDQGIELANQACKTLIAEKNFKNALKLLQSFFDLDPENFKSNPLRIKANELFYALINYKDFNRAADVAVKLELIKNPYFKANQIGIYEYASAQTVEPKSIIYSQSHSIGLMLVKIALRQPSNELLKILIEQKDLLFYFREILFNATKSFKEESNFSQIKKIIQAGYGRLFDSYHQSILTSQTCYRDTDLLNLILSNSELHKHIVFLNNELNLLEYLTIKGDKASFLNLVKLLPELPEDFSTLISKYQRQKWMPEIYKILL